MRKLKVFSVLNFVNGKQCQHIVAAHSMLEASKLMGLSYQHMREYASETSNEQDMKFALSKPGVVFYNPEGITYFKEHSYEVIEKR